MYKVIVVDDEPLILEGWKTMVDWKACGYELCGTATDGMEALTTIRSRNPDLVVTDIRMPVLDGLGLIRAMKEEPRLTAKTVIVSGYSEFGYAQQALQYEVDRYVLKPLVTEEIHALLLELAGALEERRLAEAAEAREQQAAMAAAIVGLLRNAGSAAESASRLFGAGERTRCRLLLAELPLSPSGGAEPKNGSLALQERIQALADACKEDGLRAWPFEDAPGRAGLLVLEDEPGVAAFEDLLKRMHGRLARPLQELALYCSGIGCGLADVPALYRQAMEMRGVGLLKGKTGLFLYREPAGAGECRFEDVNLRVEALVRSIEEGNEDVISASVDELLRLFEETPSKEGWMRTAVQLIRGELLRRFEGMEAERGDAPSWRRQLLMEEESAGAGASWCSWSGEKLKRLCIQAAELLASGRTPERANASAVSEAIAYLQLHFREKIRLQELAARYHLNPAYFGQQFKRETGSAFHDYLHRLRIDEARRMLRRTDLRVSEIASSLGYHDTEYFTEKFKALTGELPSSYKNKRQG